MKQAYIEKEFNRIRSSLLENDTSVQDAVGELTELELKIIRGAKEQRDKIRKLLEIIRDKYRPIRVQVDEVSKAVSEIEKHL